MICAPAWLAFKGPSSHMGFPVAYGGYAKVAWRSYPLVRAKRERRGSTATRDLRSGSTTDLQRRAGIYSHKAEGIPWGEGGMEGKIGRFWSADHGHVPIAIENLASWHLGAETRRRDGRINDAACLTHNGSRLQPRSSRTPAMAPKQRARDLISSITRHCHDVASWQPSFFHVLAIDKLRVEQEQQIWQTEAEGGNDFRAQAARIGVPKGG